MLRKAIGSFFSPFFLFLLKLLYLIQMSRSRGVIVSFGQIGNNEKAMLYNQHQDGIFITSQCLRITQSHSKLFKLTA